MEFEGDVATKTAESDSDRHQLAQEATVLRALAHPGVVAVAGTEGDCGPDRLDRLLLHRVSGRPVADLDRPSPGVLAGWGAAVATIVADIHDLGYVHGAITDDHVLIDDRGRPVLCGFGSASRLDADPDSSDRRVEDVRATARLVLDRLPEGERDLRRILSSWTIGRGRGGARHLARDLAGRAAGDRAEAEVPGPVRRRPMIRARVALAATAVMGVAGFGAGRMATGAPAVGVGVAPYVLQVARGEDPLTVVGRWRCGPGQPAVLDAASGSVWIFTGWPAPSRRTTGTLVTRIPGATGLGVTRESTGCDRLVVLRANRPDLSVPLPPERGGA